MVHILCALPHLVKTMVKILFDPEVENTFEEPALDCILPNFAVEIGVRKILENLVELEIFEKLEAMDNFGDLD